MSIWDRGISRTAVIGVVVMAIGLSACGRRAALDAPPTAAASAGAGQSVAPSAATEGEETAPPDKPFFLDFLL